MATRAGGVLSSAFVYHLSMPLTHTVSTPCFPHVYITAPATPRGAGLQGVVEARTLADARGRRYTVALLARRSRLHPGMRYIARGLNALASPGNEIECEQLVWAAEPRLKTPAASPSHEPYPDAGAPPAPAPKASASEARSKGSEPGGGFHDGGAADAGGVGAEGETPGASEVGGSGGRVRWSSFLWRRGTVPIWWGVELRSGGVGEANIVVSPNRPYRGVRRCAVVSCADSHCAVASTLVSLPCSTVHLIGRGAALRRHQRGNHPACLQGYTELWHAVTPSSSLQVLLEAAEALCAQLRARSALSLLL